MCASAACHDDKKFCNASCQSPDVAQQEWGKSCRGKMYRIHRERGPWERNGKEWREDTMTIRLDKQAAKMLYFVPIVDTCPRCAASIIFRSSLNVRWRGSSIKKRG
jgi:hypothetical protein